MIIVKNNLMGAPVNILGQDDGADGGSGGSGGSGGDGGGSSGSSGGGLFDSLSNLNMSDITKGISAAQSAAKAVGINLPGSSASKTTSAGAKVTTAVAGNFVLAPGADWAKAQKSVIIDRPRCAGQYDALAKEYARRTASQVYANEKAKLVKGTPLTQSDLVGLTWVRLAQERLQEFTDMYTMQRKYWPTTCPKGTGVGIPGYKGGFAGTGVSNTTATVGVIGVALIAGLLVWKLL